LINSSKGIIVDLIRH